MNAVVELATKVGKARACVALAVSRATFYRRQSACQQSASARARRASPRALPTDERQAVLDTLHSERFLDEAPAQVYAQLLDENRYLCSIRTMYRVLHANDEVRERRDQARQPPYQRPELLATAPNQVWSWDITKLLGPQKWTYYYLYVLLDIFSRYAVGWLLAHRESAELAQRLVRESCLKENVNEGQLIIHSDRGSPMTSLGLAQLYATLGITRSLSRPHVSNDNPFSESHFKTFKYQPDFPARFGSFEHGLAVCRPFFGWYNDEHYHSSLGLLTPAMVHYGTATAVVAQRQQALDAAYLAHPERFVRKPPTAPKPPTAVWINPPVFTPPGLETNPVLVTSKLH
jgi:putative transposase